MGIKIFLLTLPVMMGYIPLAIAYGILFITQFPQLPWYYAVVVSMVVYAGSGQFLLISLLASLSGLFEIAIASFLLNIRHIFYGISLLHELQTFRFWNRHLLIFTLTDETYAIIKESDIPQHNKETGYLIIAFLNYTYWIIGSILGIVLGREISMNWNGIEFALSALFAVLTLSLLLRSKNKTPFFVALSISFMGIFIFPSQQMLILSLLCIVVVLWILYNSNSTRKLNGTH